MNAYKLIITLGLIFSPASLWAQKNIPTEASLEQLVGEIKSSTDSIRIQALGQLLSERTPRTKREAALALELMKDEHTAPYAQMSIARSTEPALGPAFHDALKSLKAGLKHVPQSEFEKLPPDQQKKAVAQVMDITAIVHALGNIRYQPAAADLREFLNCDQKFEGYLSYETSRSLSEIEDTDAFSTMMKMAEDGKPVIMSGYKTRAVSKIVEKIEEINSTYKNDPLKVNDPRYIKIRQLTQSLGRAGGKDPAAKALLKQLLRHSLREVQAGAGWALEASVTSKDKEIVTEMMKHKDSQVRISGIRCLRNAKVWDRSFLPLLIDIMQHDPNSLVRGVVIQEMGALASAGVRRKELREAVPYLVEDLKNPDISIRSHAFDTLRNLTGKYYSYEGMQPWDKNLIKMGPDFLPEDESKNFDDQNK